MGQQQLMLIILGVIIVGIAIAVGIWLFASSSVGSNKDAIINDLSNLAQYGYRYKLRPEPLGGGGRSYVGFNIPEKLRNNENASYETTTISDSSIVFLATSNFGYGTISVVLTSQGDLTNFTYSGDW
jgi:hypothetical protein